MVNPIKNSDHIIKHCPWCARKLKRMKGETYCLFIKRVYCSKDHFNQHRKHHKCSFCSGRINRRPTEKKSLFDKRKICSINCRENFRNANEEKAKQLAKAMTPTNRWTIVNYTNGIAQHRNERCPHRNNCLEEAMAAQVKGWTCTGCRDINTELPQEGELVQLHAGTYDEANLYGYIEI